MNTSKSSSNPHKERNMSLETFVLTFVGVVLAVGLLMIWMGEW